MAIVDITHNGDIGIANQGVSSSDTASIFAATAEAERLQVEQRRKDSQRTFLIVGGAVYSFLIIALIIFLLLKSKKPNG